MKTTKVQKSAPAISSVGVAMTVESWNMLQLEAAKQDGGVREVLAKGAGTTVAIRLPAAFVDLVRRVLGARGIPASYAPAAMANALLAGYLGVDGDPLVSSYVYPSYAKAYRAAAGVFVKQHWQTSLVLSFRRRGRVETEFFRNPFTAIKAA